MGKTVFGAVRVDPEKTSPYEFYQYWRNVEDADVIKCLKMLTDVPLDQIAEMETWKDAKLNEAKATSPTAGPFAAEAEKAQQTSQSLFSTGGDLTNMPTTELTADQF